MGSSVREVRFRPRVRAQVLGLVPYVVIFVMLTAMDLDPSPWWVRWLVLLVAAASVAVRVVSLWLVLHQRWGVILDAGGVHWCRSGHHLPWSHVAEVRLFIARGWRRGLPHLPDRVVLVTRAEADFALRARSRAVGHTISTSEVRATAEQLVAGVRRFTDAPVRSGTRWSVVPGTPGISDHLVRRPG